jgi:hypothetical protein
MDKPEYDEATLAALIIRFREDRLPRAKRLLERVRGGERLSNGDIEFLERIQVDGMHVQPLVKRHPEYFNLITKAMDLYTEIIERGLENEKSAQTGDRGSRSGDSDTDSE